MARILVVEDDYAYASLVEGVLCEKGHEVVLMRRGDEATQANIEAQGPFAIAVVDVCLPGRLGTEVSADLKKLKEHMPLILVVTVLNHDEVPADVLAHADKFLFKQEASMVQIAEAVESLLRGEVS